MHRLTRRAVLVALSMFGNGAVLAAEERGTFGFSIELDGEGFFLNPTLKSITIVSVTPASPAASAGIAPRDQIVEADGHVLVGTKGRDLEPILKRSVGQALKLKLRRPGGEEYFATLVAVARSAKP